MSLKKAFIILYILLPLIVVAQPGALKRDTLVTKEGNHTLLTIKEQKGNLVEIVRLKNDIKDGLQEKFLNNYLSEKTTYKNGYQHGPKFLYDYRGNLTGKSNYVYIKKQNQSVLQGELVKYQNNIVRSRAIYKDNLLNGIYEEYQADGKLAVKANYSEGVLTGGYEEYQNGGLLKLRRHYKQVTDDKKVKTAVLDGEITHYRPDGTILLYGPYSNGKKTGEWKEYHTNGKLKSQLHYKDDKSYGPQNTWYEDGRVESRNIFYSEIEIEGKKMQSVYDGVYEKYYRNGNPETRMVYKMGKKVGLSQRFYETGILQEQQTYKDGLETGTSVYFDMDGQKKVETNFAIIEKEGKAISVKLGDKLDYTKGTLTAKTPYVNNLIHGRYEEYYVTGVLKETRQYENGLLSGEYINYHDNGQVSRKCNYTIKTMRDGKPKSEVVGWIYNYDYHGKPLAFYFKKDNEATVVDVAFKGDKLIYFHTHNLLSILYSPMGEPISLIINGPYGQSLAGYYFYRNKSLRKLAYYDSNLLMGRYAEFSDEGILLNIYAQNNRDTIVSDKKYPIAVAQEINKEWFSLPFFTDQRKEGTYLLKYNNGRTFLEAGFKDNLPHGKFLVYEAVYGDTLVYKNFNNGIPEGDFVMKYDAKKYAEKGRYHSNGHFAERYLYNKEGRLSSFNTYDTLGKLAISKEYYENGKLKRISNRGNMIRSFDKDGLATYEMLDLPNPPGWTTQRLYYPGTRQMKSESFYFENKRDSLLKYYHPNGKLMYQVAYKDNKRNGTYTEYSDTGTLNKIGNYEHDKMVGEWTDYKDSIPEVSYYKEGKLAVPPTAEQCGCIDTSLSKSDIGFANTMDVVLNYNTLANNLPPFIVPVDKFNYASLFSINNRYNSSHNSSSAFFKMLMFNEFAFYFPADRQLKIILNPCRTKGYLSNMDVSASYTTNTAGSAWVNLNPKRIAIELARSPLKNTNTNNAFTALYDVRDIEMGYANHFKINLAKESNPCYSNGIIKDFLKIDIAKAIPFLFEEDVLQIAYPDTSAINNNNITDEELDHFFGLKISDAKVSFSLTESGKTGELKGSSKSLLAGGRFVSGSVSIPCEKTKDSFIYHSDKEVFTFTAEALKKEWVSKGFTRYEAKYNDVIKALIISFFVE